MQLLFLSFAIFAMCFDASGVASPKTSSQETKAYQTKDGSILKPTNIAYTEAMEFAQFLNAKGILVKGVHASKLSGFFSGIEKASFFKTDKGVVEVIFFPEPRGAETVHVTERRSEGRHLYSFQGQPNPKPDDGFDSNRPMYFLMHRNWFIVPDSEELYETLKLSLIESSFLNTTRWTFTSQG